MSPVQADFEPGEERWPTPFHSSSWLRRTGEILLRIGDDSAGSRAGVSAALRGHAEHYYHHPATLIGGTRESAFLPEADRHAWMALPWGQVLTTVSPFGYRGQPSSRELSPDDAGRLADALIEQARALGCSALLSHYLFAGEDQIWIDALTRRGGQLLTLGAHARLELWFGDMETYFAWLGKSRRSVRSGRAWAAPDCRVHCYGLGTPVPDADALAELVHRSLSQHDAHAAPRELLDAVLAGRDFRRLVLTASPPDGCARSVLIALSWRGRLYAKFFGSTEPRGDYVPLVFNQLIQTALATGHHVIDYGGAAHQAKLLRGARLHLARGVLLALEPAIAHSMHVALRASAAKEHHFTLLRDRWEKSRLSPPAALAQRSGQPELV